MNDVSPWELPRLTPPAIATQPTKVGRYAKGNRKIAPIFLKGSRPFDSINTETRSDADKTDKLRGRK